MRKIETIAGRTIISRFTDSTRVKTESRRRKPRKNPSPASVVKINRINQERDLTAKINANFRNGDRWLTLSHQEGVPIEEAMQLISKAKKKMQRLCRKAGIQFKCIESTGIGQRSGKAHHHLIINQEVTWEIICKCWDEMQVFERRLRGEGNYQRIARYMLKNAEESKDKRGKNKKAYRCSRAVITPETLCRELRREIHLDPEDLPHREGYYVDQDSINVYQHPITEVMCVEYIQISLQPDKKPRRMAGGKHIRPEPIYPAEWGEQLDALALYELTE